MCTPCISEFKSDVEDKLQTYNKINGAIRRHFGKQMNKETKLRIYNITAKAALKFGSEAWVLKKREKQRLEAEQIKFLRHLLGITKLDKKKNQCIRKKKRDKFDTIMHFWIFIYELYYDARIHERQE